MEFRRALRILAARWWVITLAGLVGLGLAVVAANLYNGRIQPSFEARATVEYTQLENQTDAAFESRLAQAKSIASTLLDDASQGVDTDAVSGELRFSVTGPDPEASIAGVVLLRDEFLSLDTDQNQFAFATSELTRLQVEIDDVRSSVTALQPVATQLDPADAAQREQLLFEVNSLRQTIASLRIQIAFPELATTDPATLEGDLDRSEDLLERLSIGLAEIPIPETPPTTETLEMLVLQRHLQDLEQQFVSISLGLLERPDAVGPIADPFVVDRTPDSISLYLAGPVGVLAGIVVTIALLLLSDRIRRPLWGIEDIPPLQAIGVIDRARPGAGSRPWYPSAGSAKRRRQVQAFRAALDRAVEGGSTSVGIVGVSATEADIQALAADLAASIAASGHRVLLIDASFARPSRLPEYGSDRPDLADLIVRRDAEDSGAIIKQALVERTEVLGELHALRAGSAADDAADALAGRQFRLLLASAEELDELAVVAAPSFGNPATEVLSQRLDHLVLVCAARRTTRRRYEDAIADLSNRKATLFGTVLLEGRARRTKRGAQSRQKGTRRAGRGDDRTVPIDHVAENPPVPSSEEASSTNSAESRPKRRRLSRSDKNGGNPTQSKPSGGQGTPQVETPPPVSSIEFDQPSAPPVEPPPVAAQVESTRAALLSQEPAPARHVGRQNPRQRHISPRPQERQTNQAMTTPVKEAESDRDAPDTPTADRAAAERYLVDKMLLLFGIGRKESSAQLRVTDEAMVPITAGAGRAEVSARLERLLSKDAGRRTEDVERGLIAMFVVGRMSLQRWVEQDFFALHARLSNWDPAIWHLVSTTGTFQVLVAARSFDADHIRLLRNREVEKTMQGLRRSLADAAGDKDLAEALANRINELRGFDQALLDLGRRGWRPGGKANPVAELNALRELGILAIPENPAPSLDD